MSSPRRLWLLLPLVLTAFLVLPGCDTESDDDDIAGTYQLKSISGGEITQDTGLTTIRAGEPFTITIEGISISLTLTGSLRLDSGGTYTVTSTVAFSGPITSSETSTSTGRYEVDGNRLTYNGTDEDGEPVSGSGTIDGDRITITEDGSTIIFEK